ncbi:uncharacterized protein LOC128222978 isoform X1 [Mya arenaria]|uniref:uncharacterized protein LOC128222978 isoform X1 n=1 Tax=Mya arenaria TaxID=6604 RepID=UPI0022E07182|nr:uncharacterized protein LOC128222978 isoform X1 [Mya arenaria]XP_052788150.1 uncharacterized protein LOC128222978 isoform X1 [Mya arenaria]
MSTAASNYHESSQFIHHRYEDTSQSVFWQQQKLIQDEKRRQKLTAATHHSQPSYKPLDFNLYRSRGVAAVETDHTNNGSSQVKPQTSPRKTPATETQFLSQTSNQGEINSESPIPGPNYTPAVKSSLAHVTNRKEPLQDLHFKNTRKEPQANNPETIADVSGERKNKSSFKEQTVSKDIHPPQATDQETIVKVREARKNKSSLKEQTVLKDIHPPQATEPETIAKVSEARKKKSSLKERTVTKNIYPPQETDQETNADVSGAQKNKSSLKGQTVSKDIYPPQETDQETFADVSGARKGKSSFKEQTVSKDIFSPQATNQDTNADVSGVQKNKSSLKGQTVSKDIYPAQETDPVIIEDVSGAPKSKSSHKGKTVSKDIYPTFIPSSTHADKRRTASSRKLRSSSFTHSEREVEGYTEIQKHESWESTPRFENNKNKSLTQGGQFSEKEPGLLKATDLKSNTLPKGITQGNVLAGAEGYSEVLDQSLLKSTAINYNTLPKTSRPKQVITPDYTSQSKSPWEKSIPDLNTSINQSTSTFPRTDSHNQPKSVRRNRPRSRTKVASKETYV